MLAMLSSMVATGVSSASNTVVRTHALSVRRLPLERHHLALGIVGSRRRIAARAAGGFPDRRTARPPGPRIGSSVLRARY